MPLDLHAGPRTDAIDHAEEPILQAAEALGPERFPELCWLWAAFYSGPRIDPDRAGRLAAELTSIRAERPLAGPLAAAASRLAAFFAAAAAGRQPIRCVSD